VCEIIIVLASARRTGPSVQRVRATHLESAMSSKRPDFQTSQDAAFTVSIRPIGQTDLRFVQRAMAALAPAWSVELQGIRADEGTLVLLPEDGDDANGPAFMISREGYGFRVDQVHWDMVAEVGVYASLNEVVAALGMRLAFCAIPGVTASATVH
jgi:hypothetical protein